MVVTYVPCLLLVSRFAWIKEAGTATSDTYSVLTAIRQGAKAAQKRARNEKKAGTKAVSQLKTVRA